MAKKVLWLTLKDKLWLIGVLVSYHIQCFIMTFIYTCPKLLTGHLPGGFVTTDKPQQRVVRGKAMVFAGESPISLVLEHSLLVTNAREALIFGFLFGWFKPRPCKTFCYSVEGSASLKN